jgi:MoaA/NifB/PqqE/SkfB family radical SAM enzyme
MRDRISKAEQIASIKKNPHLQNTMYWHLTSFCNLQCSFCGFSKLNRNTKYIQEEVAFTLKNLDKFKNAFRELPGTWEFFIGGGEPFVFPHFLEIVRDIVGMRHGISVATNFTAPLDTLKAFCNIVGKKICLFLASYKAEVHGFTEFLHNAIQINSSVKGNGGLFSVGAVATKKDTDSLFKAGKIFNENGIEFALQVERIAGVYRKYSQSEKEKILYFGRGYGLDDTMRFRGKVCFAGINYLILIPGGDVYRCHSAIGNPTREGSYLGNMISDTFTPLKHPLKCNYDFCNCVNAYNKHLIVQ